MIAWLALQATISCNEMMRILLPTDFSDGSMIAIRSAMAMYGTGEAEIILFHTVHFGSTEPSLPSFVDEMMANARRDLLDFEKKCRGTEPPSTVRITTVVGRGILEVAIDQLARERHVDVVVMGARGQGGALRWGSNTEAVVKRCHTPVIVVPQEWKQAPLKRILYADDRYEVKRRRSVEAMLDLARRHSAGIAMVYVRRDTGDPLPVSELALNTEWFEGIKVSQNTLAGDNVVESLGQLAESGDWGMMAVLHRHLDVVEAIFHRSVAKRLALHSSVPLLVMQE